MNGLLLSMESSEKQPNFSTLSLEDYAYLFDFLFEIIPDKMLELLCHNCHISDFAKTAAEIAPECVNADIDECPSCESVMINLAANIDPDELIAIIEVGFYACKCKTALVFVGNPFDCDSCNSTYTEICEQLVSFLGQHVKLQIVDFDELLGEVPISGCLGRHGPIR